MQILPSRLVTAVGKAYPQAWRLADSLRAEKGGKLPDWPGQFFLPLGFWISHAKALGFAQIAPQDIFELQKIACAAAWRPGQDIVRLDPQVMESIADTPLDGDIPADILWRLPAWAVYVETPGLVMLEEKWEGFVARLDWLGREKCLRMMFLSETEQLEQILVLGDHSLKEAFDKTLEGIASAMGLDGVPDEFYDAKALQTAINALLYICAYGFYDRPGYMGEASYPKPKKVRTGWRLFPPDKPRLHLLGEDFGRQIREARHRGQSRPHGSPRPHIRRAHWHGFWTGPKNGARNFDLRWLPPIAVAMAGD